MQKERGVYFRKRNRMCYVTRQRKNCPAIEVAVQWKRKQRNSRLREMDNRKNGQERTEKREQVCGNLVSSVDANRFVHHCSPCPWSCERNSHIDCAWPLRPKKANWMKAWRKNRWFETNIYFFHRNLDIVHFFLRDVTCDLKECYRNRLDGWHIYTSSCIGGGSGGLQLPKFEKNCRKHLFLPAQSQEKTIWDRQKF